MSRHAATCACGEVPLPVPAATVAFIYDRTMCKQRAPKKGGCMLASSLLKSFVCRAFFHSPHSLWQFFLSLFPLALVCNYISSKTQLLCCCCCCPTRLHYQTQQSQQLLLLKVATRIKIIIRKIIIIMIIMLLLLILM